MPSYYARAEYTSTGGTDYAVPFSYIKQEFVVVEVDGVSKPFLWIDASTVRLTSPPVVGAKVVVRRASNPQKRIVDYKNTQILNAEALNRSDQQSFDVAQEAMDYALAMKDETVAASLEAAGMAARAVPDPTASDTGKFLEAVGAHAYQWSPKTAITDPFMPKAGGTYTGPVTHKAATTHEAEAKMKGAGRRIAFDDGAGVGQEEPGDVTFYDPAGKRVARTVKRADGVSRFTIIAKEPGEGYAELSHNGADAALYNGKDGGHLSLIQQGNGPIFSQNARGLWNVPGPRLRVRSQLWTGQFDLYPNNPVDFIWDAPPEPCSFVQVNVSCRVWNVAAQWCDAIIRVNFHGAGGAQWDDIATVSAYGGSASVASTAGTLTVPFSTPTLVPNLTIQAFKTTAVGPFYMVWMRAEVVSW